MKMKFKGTILGILDGEGLIVKNFIYMLSSYEEINEYEIILACGKGEKNYYSGILKTYFRNEIPVRLMEFDEVSHCAKIYNQMEEYATADILIFINVNFWLEKNCLKELTVSLEKEDIMAVQPLIVKFRTMKVQSTGYVIYQRDIRHALLNRNITEAVVNESVKRSALVSNVMAVNRYVFEELNGFNEYILEKYIGQELTYKITAAGYSNLYNHRARAYYIAQENRKLWEIKNTHTDHIDYLREKKNDNEELKMIFQQQMTEKLLEKKYIIMNFSATTQLKELIKQMKFKVLKVINYTKHAEMNNIDLEKVLPFELANETCEYIYLTNNYDQIRNNPVWFLKRQQYDDIILDMTGNIICAKELYKE
jgi:hypothetical protein